MHNLLYDYNCSGRSDLWHDVSDKFLRKMSCSKYCVFRAQMTCDCYCHTVLYATRLHTKLYDSYLVTNYNIESAERERKSVKNVMRNPRRRMRRDKSSVCARDGRKSLVRKHKKLKKKKKKKLKQ
jgi:hypothetical protein